MKKCNRGGKCATAPNELLSNACFEKTNGNSGGLRGECRKCRGKVNGNTKKSESDCSLMYFMATILWNEANSAAIYTRCSQVRCCE